MSHMTLADYYAVVNGLVDHKYSKTEVDSMYPFERDVIVSLINQERNAAAEMPEAMNFPTEF